MFTSELVIIEASAGDERAAAERLELAAALPLLEIGDAPFALGEALVQARAIPPGASRDAVHVGICAVNGMDYLLMWSFRHLANAVMKDKISQVCETHGYKPPVICTLEELQEVP